MADISITAANVHPGSASKILRVQYGVTVTAGQIIYLDTADAKYKLGDANASTTTAGADGLLVAMTNGSADDYGLATSGGLYDVGASVTEGLIYVVSGTAGGIAPSADLASGWNCSVVGIGAASNQIDLQLYASGQTVA